MLFGIYNRESQMKFNSKTLQASFDAANPILETNEFVEEIANEDIIQLESYLKACPTKETFVFNLKFRDTPAYQEELLVWDKRKQQIVYVKNTYTAACRSHEKGYYQYINYNEKEVLTEIPLLRADLSLKRQIWVEDKLALFLTLFSKNYANSPSFNVGAKV